jgi:Ser/Thr protein kinase RdoA (MazF antagonist)
MVLARGSGLAFVPAVRPAHGGQTWVEAAGRSWDLTGWQPGRADFWARPAPARLAAACETLAQLHLAWAGVNPKHGPCPALGRRLNRAREWLELVASGWRPVFPAASDDALHDWAGRAWRLLQGRVERVLPRLAPWADKPLPLQPCLCDVWHDHVLFEDDRVTGLVDYGSVKWDHVSGDLARLLGSLVGDDRGRQLAGLAAYSRLRGLSKEEKALVAALDETGTVLGAANWLRWLYREGKRFEDRSAVAGRLAALVRRMERWEAGYV